MMTIGFWIAFGVTLALLAAALWSGFRGVRRWHLLLGPATLVALCVAIAFAVAMGRERAFPVEVMRIHRPLAYAAGAFGVGVAASGVALWRSDSARRLHRVLVVAFSVAAVAATVTGVWAYLGSTPVAVSGS